MVNQTNPYNHREIGENREGGGEVEKKRDMHIYIFRASPSDWPPSKRAKLCAGSLASLVWWKICLILWKGVATRSADFSGPTTSRLNTLNRWCLSFWNLISRPGTWNVERFVPTPSSSPVFPSFLPSSNFDTQVSVLGRTWRSREVI